MNGAAAHSTRMGVAATSACGRRMPARTKPATATMGPAIIVLKNTAGGGSAPRRALAAAVSHSSSLRPVTASRTSVTTIAWTIAQASYARNVNCRAARARSARRSSSDALTKSRND